MRKSRTSPPGTRLFLGAVVALLTIALIPPEPFVPDAYAAQQKGKKKKQKSQRQPVQQETQQQAGATIGSPTTAEATNSLFTTAGTCALCHTTSAQSSAFLTEDGHDVSPDHTWRATMMANAFRDPYWRAKVEHELAAAPEADRDDLQALCLGCHGPMAAQSAKLLQTTPASVEEAADDPLAADGVSCTLCHQIQDEKLGAEESYTAGFVIEPGKTAFGQYPDPFSMPMLQHSGFQPAYSPHIEKAGLCGSCHTVSTRADEDAPAFLEQAPYLEWRNSVYSNENGTTSTSRTCIQCHMANAGTMRIAHNPSGKDFPRVGARPDVRSHAVVGGNAFMIELLEDNWEALAVVADTDQVNTVLEATRATLMEAAALSIGTLSRRSDTLEFDVTVTNLTGHKLPSSYPSRRAWLRVQVVAGRRVVFDSGVYDEDGRIVGPLDERLVPHADVIEDERDVVVYEAQPVGGDENPTMLLREMEAYGKDTRLLPKGWSASGPDAARTQPVGVGSDDDFVGGSDTVTYRVTLPRKRSDLTVHAWLLYQPLPPAWVEPLRSLETPYARAFVGMYDAADKAPEVLASASVHE